VTLILAIDQSTSATRAVLFDGEGKVQDRASREHRQIYPKPGWVEHDAEELWHNTIAVVREVAERNLSATASLSCVSVTNQRETFVVFDRVTGKSLHNAIVWQCRRGDPICEQLRCERRDELVRNRTGLKLDTYFSGSKLKWLISQNPDLASKLQKGDALIGTIDTWLLYRLTDGKVFATDHTNASRTLLLDVHRLRWDPDLCAVFGVPSQALPEVRESSARFGETNVAGVLPNHIPIIGVMGDSQASLFAQRCFQPGMIKATFGTGTSILVNIGHKFRLPEKDAVLALAWVAGGQPTYALEGLINYSAATIKWLKDQLGLLENSSDAGEIAATVENNAGVYLIPAFAGLSAPYWSPQAKAAIVGMTAYTRREHIVRAAEEAIAYQIRDVLDAMRDGSGIELSSLHADGGPTRDAFLMQFTADMTGVPIKVAEISESSAWGAAMAGLLGLGVRRSVDDLAALPQKIRTYEPKMKANDRETLHAGWRAAVQRVL
jgi:glycerol kinase